MLRTLAKLPLLLVFAVVMGVGTTLYMVLDINLPTPLASWDPRYAAYNGTHIYRTGAMIPTTYKTLYLGYGTAYFRNPVNVYYLRKVFAGGVSGDLGGYLPVLLIIESGGLPLNTYITWTDPYTGRVRKLYLVSGANRGYVIGEFTWIDTPSVASIPVYYRVVGNVVYIYPMEQSAVATYEGCSILRNAGFTGTYYQMWAVLDSRYYDCLSWFWSVVLPVDWARVASSATSAELRPSPTHYMVTVNVGGGRVTIMLSYWYAVDSDPGFFAVRIGSE